MFLHLHIAEFTIELNLQRGFIQKPKKANQQIEATDYYKQEKLHVYASL